MQKKERLYRDVSGKGSWEEIEKKVRHSKKGNLIKPCRSLHLILNAKNVEETIITHTAHYFIAPAVDNGHQDTDKACAKFDVEN